VDRSSIHDSHQESETNPFDGTVVLDDHRDHNLLVRRAKAELRGLPDVDWTVAPHFVHSQDADESADNSSSVSSVVGFDVAGFEYTSSGQRLQYMGIVTDWDEKPGEVYPQVAELGKTAATGIVIFPNREHIYDFLQYLKTADLNHDLSGLPEERDEYSSVPNVPALHEQMISKVPLLEGIALLPRRKFLDEGFDTISDLVSVQTYVRSEH
jgi:hypothetical protein